MTKERIGFSWLRKMPDGGVCEHSDEPTGTLQQQRIYLKTE